MVRVDAPEDDFQEKCRGPVDSNGVPLRKIVELEEVTPKRRSSPKHSEPPEPDGPVALKVERADDGLAPLPEVRIASTPSDNPNPYCQLVAGADQPLRECPGRALTLSDFEALPPRERRAERYAALRRAWEFFIAAPEVNYWDLGVRLNATPAYLRRSFDGFAQEPGAPKLKPNGKL